MARSPPTPDTPDTSAALAKISRPRGNRSVARPRLFALLDSLLPVPVVWIAGAPGAGKTTLVSSYLAERQLRHLWYQLDADDADAATFFYYFGMAVQHAAIHPQRPLSLLTPEYLPGLLSFTRRYAEAIAAAIAAPAVLVLDNYEQLPAEAALHDVLRELAACLPRGLTLVLSRTEPPPSCARLRLNGDLALIDGHALDLTPDEGLALAAARLRSAGVSPPDSTPHAGQVARLLQASGGWLAGFTLLLAEGGAGGQPATGGTTQQLLFDYFATELFERFAPVLQDALLRTAPLPTMTLAQAGEISGHPAVAGVLVDLHRQNCFVVLRGQATYEYHALFRAFLLSRAVARFPAEEWRALQRRAADLLAQAGQPDAAATLYRAGGDTQGLAALALQQAPALVSAGRHHLLAAWLAELPSAAFQQAAWLHHWRAAARLPFDPVMARDDFARAYAGLQRQQDVEGQYATWAGAMESFFFEWRDFSLADSWIDEFAHLRARHPVFPSRAVELRTYGAMGTLLHRQPQHPLLPAWSERALALLDPQYRDLSVLLGGYLIIWHLWRGETPMARAVIERVMPWVVPEMAPMVRVLWSCAVALYHSVQGDMQACRQPVEEGLALARSSGLQSFDALLCAQMARCAVVAGDRSEAQAWMAAMGSRTRGYSHVDGAFHCHLHGNAAAQLGDWQQALEYAQSGMAMAMESGIPFLQAHCHIELGRALLGTGDTSTWAGQIAAARRIGEAMHSRVILYLCLETEAVAAFDAGQRAPGLDLLAQALALSRAMDGATWLMAGPALCARLYDIALGAGIEADHVRRMVRRRRLQPPVAAEAPEAWPWPVRVHTLGRFDVVLDEVPLRAAGKAQNKPLELLKCLCALGGQAHQDRVTDALWPDSEGDAADQALRTTLHRLRKLLRHDEAVRLEARQLSLDSHAVWVDCLAFDQLAHAAPADDRHALQAALQRYGGAFLPGESAPWAMACRDRLRAHTVRIAERLTTLLEQDGDAAAMAQCCLLAIEAEPLAELFHRRLMQAYARAGRRTEALAAYQRCRQLLLTRLGVSPSAETQALHRALADAP